MTEHVNTEQSSIPVTKLRSEKLAYSVTEVAEMLSLSRAATYQYVRSGEIRSVTLGGRIIIPCSAIEDLLDKAA